MAFLPHEYMGIWDSTVLYETLKCSLIMLFPALSPQVVANAVAALSEISESHPNSNLLDLNPQNINKLLTALNECTEWGQIFILDCLSNYNPKDEREAQRYIISQITIIQSHSDQSLRTREVVIEENKYSQIFKERERFVT